MTRLGTTLEEELGRRNTAVNTVAVSCKLQEGGTSS